MDTPDTRPARPYRPDVPTVRGLIMAHKRVSAAILAILVASVAIIVITGLNSKLTRVSDSTPCSAWSSASDTMRSAYAALYVKEHGALPSGASDAGTVEGVIDDGCTAAYSFDEADTVTVLQALRKQY